MAIRFGLPAALGFGVTMFLFYLMQYLISTADKTLMAPVVGQVVDIVRVKTKIEPVPTRDRAPKPPEPEVPPLTMTPKLTTTVEGVDYTQTKVRTNSRPLVAGPRFESDGEYLPLFKVEPIYPRRAAARGLSGWAIVEFTVTTRGMVKDALVISNCAWTLPPSSGQCVDSPNSVFDSSARRAALKFKYKPRVVGGEYVETTEVRNLIVYNMAEG